MMRSAPAARMILAAPCVPCSSTAAMIMTGLVHMYAGRPMRSCWQPTCGIVGKETVSKHACVLCLPACLTISKQPVLACNDFHRNMPCRHQTLAIAHQGILGASQDIPLSTLVFVIEMLTCRLARAIIIYLSIAHMRIRSAQPLCW